MSDDAPSTRWAERRLGWTRADVASNYDAVRFKGRLSRVKHRNDARLVQKLLAEVGSQLTVLDAPTGTGRIVPELLRAGHRVTGVDLSEAMLHEAGLAAESADGAATGSPGGARWGSVLGEIEALPFASGTFDAIVSLRFLFHARDPGVRRRLFDEFARVAQYVVGHERSRATFKDRSRRVRARLGLGRARYAAPSEADLRAELAMSGLTLVRTLRVSRLFSDKIVFLAKRAPKRGPAPT